MNHFCQLCAVICKYMKIAVVKVVKEVIVANNSCNINDKIYNELLSGELLECND